MSLSHLPVDGGLYLLPATNVGATHATRVVVKAGAFKGWKGLVARINHPTNVSVRFMRGGVEVELPFAPSELEVVR